MAKDEFDRIIISKQHKYIPATAEILYRCGLIILAGICIGALTARFIEIPADVPLDEIADVRLYLGITVGFTVTIAGLFAYGLYIWLQGRRMAKEATDEMVAAAIRNINQSANRRK